MTIDRKAFEEYQKVVDAVSSGHASVGVCDILSVHSKTGRTETLTVIVSKGLLAEILEKTTEALLKVSGIHPSPIAETDESKTVWHEV